MSLWKFGRNVALTCGLTASAMVASAQTNLVPQSGEYAIAGTLPGDQLFPAASINAGGGFLVWQDNSVTTFGLRIQAQLLGGNLMSGGAPFVVSAVSKSKSTGDQEKPQVALLQGGGAVVVWQGGKQGRQQIFARFMDATGAFLTKDVRVSAFPKINQMDAQVATLAGGNVVIVWSSFGQDGDMLGVFARLFSPTGQPLGLEFQVNQFSANNQRNPAVAALANGNFVVTWVSELQTGPASIDVYARIFGSSGLPVADEFAVDTITNQVCANPALAASPQGGFAVAWSQNGNRLIPTAVAQVAANNVSGLQIDPNLVGSTSESTNGWDVVARLFDVSGAPLGSQFTMNQYTYGDQFAPKIAASGTAYMAVWSSLSQPDPQTQVVDPLEGVFGQLISSNGTVVLTNDLHVNTSTLGRQLRPIVVSDGSGRFLSVWGSIVTTSGSSSFGTFDLEARQFQQTGG